MMDQCGKKFFIMITVLVLSCSLFGILAQARETVDQGSCGEQAAWTLYDDGQLVISGEGNMIDYHFGTTPDYAPWYSYRNNITGVLVESGVTGVGAFAFYNCPAIEEAVIGDGVTNIGSYAFQDCSHLADIQLGSSVVYIGAYAFARTALTSLELPFGVKTVDTCAFCGCSALENITIPNSVTNLGPYAFSACESLKSAVLPDKLTNVVSYLFDGCTSLISVTIPDSVTAIEYGAFSGCQSLTDVTIPKNVTRLGGGAFSGCSALTSITIPDGVTEIEGTTFLRCSSLTEITIPKQVRSIGYNAFYGCTSLTGFEIPDRVTVISTSLFMDCTALTGVVIPDKVTMIVGNAFSGCENLTYAYYTGTQDAWQAVSINPEGNEPLLHIIRTGIISFGQCGENTYWALSDRGELFIDGNGAMEDYTEGAAPWYSQRESVTSVVIAKNVTAIGSNAFSGFDALTSVEIPDSVTRIGEGAFDQCRALSEVEYGAERQAWEAIEIGERNTPLADATIRFYEPEITVQGSCGETVTWVLYSNGELVIEGTGAMDDFSLFGAPWNEYIDSIQKVSVRGNVTHIGNFAFSFCEELTKIELSSEVTGIGTGAFAYCAKLETVAIPNGTESIDAHAFYSCSLLSSVSIPASVTQIGELAFFYCDALTVSYSGTEEQWEDIKKGEYAFSETAVFTYGQGETLKGDVNQDGFISVNDLVFFIHYFSVGGELSEQGRQNGDISGDGHVMVNDLVMMLSYFSTGSWE